MFLSLNDDGKSNVLKAFITRVANRSEGDIMNHVLVLEIFQQFSNTQTYLNKSCLDVKTFCEDTCFVIAFVKLTETCLLATPHILCQGVTHQQEP